MKTMDNVWDKSDFISAQIVDSSLKMKVLCVKLIGK